MDINWVLCRCIYYYVFSGQNIKGFCTSSEMSDILSCFSQLEFLYSPQNNGSAHNCYDNCTTCVVRIKRLLSFPTLNQSMWLTQYPGFFKATAKPYVPSCPAPQTGGMFFGCVLTYDKRNTP